MTYRHGRITLELEPDGDGELAWGCELPFLANGVFGVASQMLRNGYRNYTSHPLRIRLAHPKGHRVDILPARRCIRIRLQHATRPEDRRDTAMTLVGEICESLVGAQRTRTTW